MSNLESRYLGDTSAEVTNDISGMYDNALDNSIKLERYANENDLVIKLPKENELFIDLDTEQGYQLFQDQLEVLSYIMDIVKVDVNPSRSGLPHRHVVVTVRVPSTRGGVLSVMERLALQTMLGSDRRCEILRYVRHCFKDPHPTLFLEKTDSSQEVNIVYS